MKEIKKIKPVFICGLPKSGTTLILSILDGHSQLAVFPIESRYFIQLFSYLEKFKSGEEVASFIINHTGFALFNPESPFFKRTISSYENQDLPYLQALKKESFFNFLKETLSKYKQFEISNIFYATLEAYLKEKRRKISKIKYFVEKTPRNEFFLKIIKTQFPEFKIIHIIRNPLDNFASLKRFSLKRFGWVSYKFFGEWNKSVKIALENRNPKNYLVLKYEDLVLFPQKAIEKIADFLEIPFEENLLIPTLDEKLWHGNSTLEYKFEKISSQRINSYQDILSFEEEMLVNFLCKEKMERIGYLGEKIPFLKGISRFAKIIFKLPNKNKTRLLYSLATKFNLF